VLLDNISKSFVKRMHMNTLY